MKHTTKYALIASVLASMALLPEQAGAELKHRYQFNDTPGSTTVSDSVSSANGTLINTTGTSAFDGNKLTLGNDGSQVSNGDGAAPPNPTGDFVDLPNGLITGLNTGAGTAKFTIETWFTRTGGNTWQRIFDFGMALGGEGYSDNGGSTPQFFLTPQSGDGTLRLAWRPNAGAEVSLNRPGIPAVNQQVLATFVWDETSTSARLYINGILVDENVATTMTLANGFYNGATPMDVNVWLGRSQWNDSLYVGNYEEFRIWDNALTPQEVLNNYANGPDDLEGPGTGALTGIDVTTDGLDVVINATTQVSVAALYENITVTVTTAPEATFVSDNENVATVDAAGVVTGVGPGSAQITATYLGQSDVVTVKVVVPARPPATIMHRYQFSEAPGAVTAADSVGAADGDARNVTFNGSGSVTLEATQMGHVNLPNGIISSLGNVTIETWATFAGNGANWQRLYDIGTTTLGEDPDPAGTAPDYNGGGASTYLFYAPRRGAPTGADAGRFTFRNGVSEIVGVNPPAATRIMPGQEAHVVTIYNYSQRQAQVWVNGALVGQSSIPNGETLSKLDDVNVWLGRSQYKGDAFLNGSFNEFRIYEGAMGPFEIAASRTAGPDVTTLIGDPGAASSLSMSVAASTAVEGSAPIPVTVNANFTSINNVDVTGVPGITITSSDPSVVQVLTNPYRLLPVGPGVATISGSLDGEAATPLGFTVTAAGALTLAHRYALDTDANDSIGAKNGTLVATGVDPAGTFENGGLTLTGTGYVDLPNYLFSDFFYDAVSQTTPPNDAVTLELFGSWAGGGNWQRLLDFGDNVDQTEDPVFGASPGGRTFIFITPSNGGNLRLDSNDSLGSLGQVNGTPLGANQDFHIVVVFDIGNGITRLYRNGVLAGIGTIDPRLTATLANGTGINDINCWLGRAQFNDPLLRGRITEFRMWQGAMNQAQVTQNFGCGPDSPDGCSLPGPTPTIAFGRNGNAVNLSWPTTALGFGLESTTALGAGSIWAPVAAQPLTTGATRTTTLTPATPTYYRLKAGN